MIARRSDSGLTKVRFAGNISDFNFGNRLWFPVWHLESLINRFLSFQHEGRRSNRELNVREWTAFAEILNTLNALENAESLIDVADDGILHAIQRLFWPQYSWQVGYDNRQKICRNWVMYSGPEAKRVFKEKYDIELHEFLRIGFMIFASSYSKPVISEKSFSAHGATTIDVMKTTNILSKEYGDLIRIAKSHQSELQNAAYNRSAIRENPIIRIVKDRGRLIVIPLPELLIARITDGLYYDIVSDGSARNEAGVAFEEISREMLAARLSHGWSLIEPEKTIGDGCCDMAVISERGDCRVLIECKARRIARRVSKSAMPWSEAKSDYDDIIKGVSQIWRTAHLWSGAERDMIGTVLLLDPWMHLAPYGDEIFAAARSLSLKKFGEGFREIPVGFASSDEFEKCSSELETESFVKSLSKLSEKKMAGYTLLAEAGNGSRADSFDYNQKISESISWWKTNWD